MIYEDRLILYHAAPLWQLYIWWDKQAVNNMWDKGAMIKNKVVMNNIGYKVALYNMWGKGAMINM